MGGLKDKQVNVGRWSGSYWKGGCRKVNGNILQSALERGHRKVVGSSRRHTFWYCLLQVSYFKQEQLALSSRPRHQPPLPSVPTTTFLLAALYSQDPGHSSGVWCFQSQSLHWVELLFTWLWSPRPGPYTSLSPGFASAADSHAGYYAGVGLGQVNEYPGNYSSYVCSLHICIALS